MLPMVLVQVRSAPEIEQFGSAFTVNIAAVEFTTPQLLLNCARYCLPSSLKLVVNVSVVLVAPDTFVKFRPPSPLACH